MITFKLKLRATASVQINNKIVILPGLLCKQRGVYIHILIHWHKSNFPTTRETPLALFHVYSIARHHNTLCEQGKKKREQNIWYIWRAVGKLQKRNLEECASWPTSDVRAGSISLASKLSHEFRRATFFMFWVADYDWVKPAEALSSAKRFAFYFHCC